MELFGIIFVANLATFAFIAWFVIIVLAIHKKQKQKAINEFLKKGK